MDRVGQESVCVDGLKLFVNFCGIYAVAFSRLSVPKIRCWTPSKNHRSRTIIIASPAVNLSINLLPYVKCIDLRRSEQRSNT